MDTKRLVLDEKTVRDLIAKKPTWKILVTKNGMTCGECGDTADHFIDGIAWSTTSGLEPYGVPELEMVIDLPDGHIAFILNVLAHLSVSGQILEDGLLVGGILRDYDVKLAKAPAGNQFLRVLLPDKNGRWPDDQACEYPFSLQLLPLAMLSRDTSAPHS